MPEKIEPPKEITTEILAMATQAERTLKLIKSFKIDSDESYTLAGQQLKKIKDTSRDLGEKRMNITRPIDLAKKNIIAFFSKPLDFLAKAEKVIKDGMIDYDDIKEKARIKEQKRLDEEAEQLRLEEEKKKEQEKKDNPVQAEDSGPKDMTAEVVADPMDAVVVPAKSTISAPKVKGISSSTVWYADITDPKQILKGVVAGTIPMAAITINESFFNTQAKALKAEFNYPGAVAKSRKQIRA